MGTPSCIAHNRVHFPMLSFYRSDAPVRRARNPRGLPSIDYTEGEIGARPTSLLESIRDSVNRVIDGVLLRNKRANRRSAFTSASLLTPTGRLGARSLIREIGDAVLSANGWK